MPLRHAIFSCSVEASRDDEPSRTIENLNIPSRVTKQVEAPPPTIEGITQMLSNWEILIQIQIQTRATEIQDQAIES